MPHDDGMEELKRHLEENIRWKVGLENRVTNLEHAVDRIEKAYTAEHAERVEERRETRRWFNRYYVTLLGGMITLAIMVGIKLFG